jgi:hypothetical protein
MLKMSAAISPLRPVSWHAQRYLSLYLEGQTDINVGKKQTIIFGHINGTNFLTITQSIKDEQ